MTDEEFEKLLYKAIKQVMEEEIARIEAEMRATPEKWMTTPEFDARIYALIDSYFNAENKDQLLHRENDNDVVYYSKRKKRSETLMIK